MKLVNHPILGYGRYARKTVRLAEELAATGYTIIVGNDPFLAARPKWAEYDCIRIAQTNSRLHGYSIRTVWAVKPK
ncbi:MAG: hypothetical protein KatS3mg051_1537 [Anaerolineae bacterium]|nr:MAG: hypothetical protein KatS3mg051_1537 [Anaerolineae bacterium]